MARRKKYNPEKRAWKGRSYRKWGERISELSEKEAKKEKRHGEEPGQAREPS